MKCAWQKGLFEGMKAYRTPDGEVQIFRPEENALRMRMGAERLLMPSPSVEQYVDAIKQVVNANKRWVDPLLIFFFIFTLFCVECMFDITMYLS
jgi:branched-subunit amino acid aminotransferase/4-amino-4-deoxychorismate lyase